MTRLLVALPLLALTLTGCGGGGEVEPAGGEVGEDAPAGATGPVPAGGEYVYPDGLVVSVGDWREEATDSPNPPRVMRLDLTASNPTGDVIETTQAWVSVRAGDTGEKLGEWSFGPSLDAVLQPGAETSATYSYDIPQTPGHVVATVSWLEATDAANRPPVEFILED